MLRVLLLSLLRIRAERKSACLLFGFLLHYKLCFNIFLIPPSLNPNATGLRLNLFYLTSISERGLLLNILMRALLYIIADVIKE